MVFTSAHSFSIVESSKHVLESQSLIVSLRLLNSISCSDVLIDVQTSFSLYSIVFQPLSPRSVLVGILGAIDVSRSVIYKSFSPSSRFLSLVHAFLRAGVSFSFLVLK